ncbi:MAG: 5'/3'-nucleotidase SurE [Bradymonadia bacterium]
MTSQSPRPTALVTNDDGINSAFLWTLVESLEEAFDVTVVAPDGERSWTGRGFTRHGTLNLTQSSRPNAFALDGTPTDCVNIGIGHVMSNRPDVVLSGINLGFNMSLPLISTSGTVAGALEGALWGIHGVASSFHIPFDVFDSIKDNHGRMEGDLQTALVESAKRTTEYALELCKGPPVGTVVHNLNFPSTMSRETPVEDVALSNLRLGSVYRRLNTTQFTFQFPSKRDAVFSSENTDFSALKRGHASICKLHYDQLTPAK